MSGGKIDTDMSFFFLPEFLPADFHRTDSEENHEKESVFCYAQPHEIYQPLGADAQHKTGKQLRALSGDGLYRPRTGTYRKPIFREASGCTASCSSGNVPRCDGNHHGDMPTPVKYYSPVIRQAYAGVEQVARDQLLEGLPEEMREDYRPLLMPTEEEKELWKYVKAADSISAYLKCIEERNMGNEDLRHAEQSIREKIQNLHLPEAEFFIEHFLPAYEGTLDESGEQES